MAGNKSSTVKGDPNGARQDPDKGSSKDPPAKTVANSALKQPPPEPSAHKALRTRVILSFWAIVILLGVPLWWITTCIYRAPLPLKEMNEWAEGRTCRAEFPLLVDVLITGEEGTTGKGGNGESLEEVEALLRNVQLALDDAREGFKASHLRLRLASNEGTLPLPSPFFVGESGRSCNEGDVEDTYEENEGEDGNDRIAKAPETIAAILRLLPGAPGSTIHGHIVHSSSRVIDLFYASTYNSASSASSATLAKYIAKTLQDVFAEEEQMITYLLEKAARTSGQAAGGELSSSNGNGNTSGVGAGSSGQLAVQPPDISRKMARIIKYSPTYHLTFSLFTASGVPSSWGIQSAISTYLAPLLAALSPISNFTVDSQVQFYASFSPTVHPEFNEQLKAWTLKKEDLSNFINYAEWPLTSIKNYPTMNFIIYIPGEQYSPLIVPESTVGNARSSAWLLPQWGGVVILNPQENPEVPLPSLPQHLSTLDLKPALDIFAAQLLSLLGTPSATRLNSRSLTTSLPIRLDSLTRQRSAEVLLSASSTMGSLSRLVLALPNISIPRSVAISVEKTLRALEKSCEELKQGRFLSALRYGRYAEAEAEKAFFERTMVAQVYFPEEHKVAVYLPLLGPVGVPLLMGLFRILKERLTDWRTKVKVKAS